MPSVIIGTVFVCPALLNQQKWYVAQGAFVPLALLLGGHNNRVYKVVFGDFREMFSKGLVTAGDSELHNEDIFHRFQTEEAFSIESDGQVVRMLRPLFK